MRKTVLLLFFTSLLFSQGKPTSLEDRIYHAIDVFVANPTVENLDKLTSEEKTFHPKTQAEWLALVILKCNKAYYQNQSGHIQKAISSYEKAWELYQKNKLSGYDMVESCLQPLGNLYTLTGDYENAENVIKQYYYRANLENNQDQKFAALLNLSNVYQFSGKHQQAIDLLEKTLQAEKLTRVQKGRLWTNLGNNYLGAANREMAAKCYDRSIDFLEGQKDQNETLSNSYRNAALLHNDPELFRKAKKLFFEAQTKEPRKIAALYRDEATLFFQRGKPENASHCVALVFKTLLPGYNVQKKILPDTNSLYAETILLDALDLQAASFLSLGQPKKALECYQLAFHVENLLQSGLFYENSKIIQQEKNRNRTEKCLAIYYSLYLKEKKDHYIEAAFLLAEQTKSAVLRQSILASKNQTREEKQITTQIRNWNTIILKEQQKAEKADISKINEAIKKQNRLMLLLKSAAPAAIQSKAWELADLYAQLDKDKAIMATYFFGREKLAVFTLENGKIKLEFIGHGPDVTPKLIAFIDLFSDSGKIQDNPLAYNKLANSTYSMLRLPKDTALKNLIIVPDGILNFLPFEALITQKSSHANFAKMHYLLQEYKIGYNPSAGFYLNAVRPEHEKESVFGVFPLFEGTPLELAFSKKELLDLKSRYPGKFLDNKQASFANFKKNAHNYSILHLSTHASSGDTYEPASIVFSDREVLYPELYDLNLQPNLVVLSACETGIGKLYKSEGAMSVARGFQFAGAQNLLFSLWKVNDFTTSVCMDKFYENLKDGRSYFEANHQAKLDFLNDTALPDAKKSPYYWSAFVYYGTLENGQSGHNLTWFWVILGIFGLLLLGRLAKKRT